jgi:subtilisin-like proprotein convertase family protein
MFVLPVPGDQVGQERRFVLEMSGHRTAEVTGRLLGGSMVLHASLLAGTDTPPDTTPAIDPGTPTPAPTGELNVATTDAAVPVRDYTTVEQHVEITQDCTIGRAAVVLDLQHSYVADLRVALRAPSGTEVVLHNHQSGSRRSLATTIDWDDRRGALHALAGQNARGRWTLSVRDSVGADSGTLTSFAMRFTCGTVTAAAPAPQVSTGRPSRPQYGRSPRPMPGSGLISPWGPATQPQPIPQVTPPTTTMRRTNGGAGDGIHDPWQ